MRSSLVASHIWCAIFIFGVAGCQNRAPQQARNSGSLRQVATISSLMEGVYDGEMSCAELKAQASLGIGTFDGLDGEMVLLDSKIYQIRADGVATPAPDQTKTPFATVVKFQPQISIELPAGLDFQGAEALLDKLVPATNYPVAFRLNGQFSHMKTRCPPRQNKPYKPLAEALANQPTFEFKNVQGVLVGFRLPKYMQQINVPGYHLHFLTQDRSAGGHVLDFGTQSVSGAAQVCTDISVRLPATADFQGAALNAPNEAELNKVERERKK